jgi:hypothetical protein
MLPTVVWCNGCCSEDGIKIDPNFSRNHRILGVILWENNNPIGINLLKHAANLGDEMANPF